MRCALGHCLIAALPARACLTTNYDTLFETACKFVIPKLSTFAEPNKFLSILPYNPKRVFKRWLLKMHGCISNPKDIVLSQDDYDNYATSPQQALAGLVQSELMTGTMLFVGFSMTVPGLRIGLGFSMTMPHPPFHMFSDHHNWPRNSSQLHHNWPRNAPVPSVPSVSSWPLCMHPYLVFLSRTLT